MKQIIEALQKAEHPLDQVLVGFVRVSRTLDTAIKIAQSARATNLGEDSNALIDELLVIGAKLQAIVGTR